MDLETLNRLPDAEAKAALRACCGSKLWAAKVAAHRPFSGLDHLLSVADEAWWELTHDDWLIAFAAHPRIGERPSGEGAHARWSAGEQATALRSDDAVRAEIAHDNREYEERFGHVFLISAAGKSGEEILAELRRRMRHSPATELEIAAEEQAKITRLRLERLITEPESAPSGA